MGTSSVKPARAGDYQILTVAVQELTPESFAPYGEVSQPTAGFRVELGAGSPSVCHVRANARPMTLRFLARHTSSTQVYSPIGGHASVLVVAPPCETGDDSGLPDPRRIAAFRLDGSCAVNLHRGTWHRTPMPTGDHADFLVVDREGTLCDVELIDLVGNFGIMIEVAR
jgi:ureidoglycolate lyase